MQGNSLGYLLFLILYAYLYHRKTCQENIASTNKTQTQRPTDI